MRTGLIPSSNRRSYPCGCHTEACSPTSFRLLFVKQSTECRIDVDNAAGQVDHTEASPRRLGKLLEDSQLLFGSLSLLDFTPEFFVGFGEFGRSLPDLLFKFVMGPL